MKILFTKDRIFFFYGMSVERRKVLFKTMFSQA